MIRSFRSRALKAVWSKADASKISPALADRLRRRLDVLHVTLLPQGMNVPGFSFHTLRGWPVRYTIDVNGPWCVTFEWDGEDAILVDLVDYHRTRKSPIMAAYKAEPSVHQPTHPGAILREDVLAALRISVTDAAGKLGVSRQTLHAILSERASVTAEMAVRLGKFCGNGRTPWLRLQQARDLWQAEIDLSAAIETIPTLQAA